MHHHSAGASDTVIGTIGGTLITVLSVSATKGIETIIVAAIGATTSFLVSKLLKYITDRFKKP
jgi:hypothetical protein